MVASTAGSTWFSATNATLRESWTLVARGNIFGLLCCPAFCLADLLNAHGSDEWSSSPNLPCIMSTCSCGSNVVSNGVTIPLPAWSPIGDIRKSPTSKSSSSCSFGKTVMIVVVRLSCPLPFQALTPEHPTTCLGAASSTDHQHSIASPHTRSLQDLGDPTCDMVHLLSCSTFWIYLLSWHSWRRLCTLPAGLMHSQIYHSVSSSSGTHFRCTLMPRGKHLSGVVDG